MNKSNYEMSMKSLLINIRFTELGSLVCLPGENEAKLVAISWIRITRPQFMKHAGEMMTE